MKKHPRPSLPSTYTMSTGYGFVLPVKWRFVRRKPKVR